MRKVVVSLVFALAFSAGTIAGLPRVCGEDMIDAWSASGGLKRLAATDTMPLWQKRRPRSARVTAGCSARAACSQIAASLVRGARKRQRHWRRRNRAQLAAPKRLLPLGDSPRFGTPMMPVAYSAIGGSIDVEPSSDASP